MQRPLSVLLATLVAATGCGRSAPAKTTVAPEATLSPAGPTEPREQTADQQVTHVLSRLTFGARPGDVERVRQMGVDRWIQWQLRPERIDDGTAERFFAGFETYSASPAELERKYPRPNQLLNMLGARGDRSKLSRRDSARLHDAAMGFRKIGAELMAGRVARAALTERQLQEVMTDFWLNHFSVYLQKGGPEPYLIAEFENKDIRLNALGKFRTLLEAVAKSPAMLFYLDNWESQADSNRPRLVVASDRGGRGATPQQIERMIERRRRSGLPVPPRTTPGNAQQQLNRRRGGLNENYGRELLELHTLGVDGGYTQQDVINAARALTGWTIRQPQQGAAFVFNPAFHDAGEKVILGHTLRAGRGIEDGEEVLDIVARHPSTAKFIAFKLARRFVSDAPPAALVDRAAETFRRTDGDIREVVRTIVTSPEFFSSAAYRSKVKSPFEVVTSALRALGGQPDPTPRTAQIVAALGQPIYGHQAPNGWPETGEQWMNTGAILNRINFGLAFGANRVPGVLASGWPGADQLENATREKQVDGVVAALLAGAASPDTRAILTSGENPFLKKSAADTMPDAQKKATPEDPDIGMLPTTAGGLAGLLGLRTPPRNRALGPLPEAKGLAQIVGLAIGSPEFQRR